MSNNTGKRFEADFKKSIPSYALLYRLPDSAQVFSRSNNLRFSLKNPFDYLMWDSKKHILYALELKTVAGKSITFERNKDENKEIHFHQIQGLNQWDKYEGIVCGFIIEFRKLEKTIFINIKDFNRIIDLIPKKSFNYNDLDIYNIKHTIISQKKARTRFTYGVNEFLETIKE
ncbi:MAG: Holliday junction resolvase RecU [Bacteroidales bacterium]|nr:Holliday junction resolvase RecU [Bacteroidales bacterium]